MLTMDIKPKDLGVPGNNVIRVTMRQKKRRSVTILADKDIRSIQKRNGKTCRCRSRGRTVMVGKRGRRHGKKTGRRSNHKAKEQLLKTKHEPGSRIAMSGF